MSKRKFSQETASTIPASLSLTQTVRGTHTNDREVIVKEKRKNKQRQLTYRQLYDIICPKYIVKRRMDGNAMSSHTRNGTYVMQSGTNLTCDAGYQQIYSFCHLPWKQTLANDAWESITMLELYTKARDILNLGFRVAGTTPPNQNEEHKFDCNFVFDGGYTKHVFTNTCNAEIHLELNFFRPKRALYYEQTVHQGIQPLPAHLSVNDKVYTNPYAESNDPYTNDAVHDQVIDTSFRYLASDIQLNANYSHTKKYAKLGPGQKLTVFVDHPGFNISIADFLAITARPNVVAGGVPFTNNIIPGFTVFLDVRAHAQMGHNENYTVQGFMAHQLQHYQEEYFACRAVPPQKPISIIVQDVMNARTGANQLMNEETEQEMPYAE